MKRKGITKIGWNGPHGIEWNPNRWPEAAIDRLILMLKAARPLL